MTDGHNYVVLRFDGAANPNYAVTHPRYSSTRTSCGFVVKSSSGQLLHREAVFLGNGTSNTAELYGCLLGVTWCLENGFRRIRILGDSENVVGYLRGEYKIPRHHPHIAHLLYRLSLVLAVESIPFQARGREDAGFGRRIRLLASDASRAVAIAVEHVPRHMNWEADKLAASALR